MDTRGSSDSSAYGGNYSTMKLLDDDSASPSRQRRKKKVAKYTCVSYNRRRIKDSGVFFVLLWNFLVFSYLQSALNNLVNIMGIEINEPWKKTVLNALLIESLPKILYPFAGWLADAKLGRYKVMRYSLWLIWAGSFFLILIAILKYVLVFLYGIEDHTHYYLLPFLVVIYAFNAVGFAGYHVNVIPFGIDQMEDQSGENICAFIHWYYWTKNFNVGMIIQSSIVSYCDSPSESRKQGTDLGNHVIQMAFLTAALCLDFLYSSKLKKDVKLHDPVKKVRDVTVFIARHNQLVGRRKAHTFSYDAPPVRSDFAKSSYGGPYEDDVVEDVTAFWRIMAFLFVGTFLMQTGSFSYSNFIQHMRTNSTLTLTDRECSYEYIIINLVSALTFTIVIPIHEFLIYPFFRKYIPRMTVRIGLGLIIVLIGLSLLLTIDAMGHSQLTIDAVGHSHSDMYNASTCVFYESSVDALDINYTYLIPIIILTSIGELLIAISLYEFICAQSPYGMRGLILGLYFMIFSLCMGVMCTILTAFALGFKDYAGTSLSCGTSYIMSVIVLGIVGFIFYIFTANWYKKRQRGGQTDINHQTIIESYYEK